MLCILLGMKFIELFRPSAFEFIVYCSLRRIFRVEARASILCFVGPERANLNLGVAIVTIHQSLVGSEKCTFLVEVIQLLLPSFFWREGYANLSF